MVQIVSYQERGEKEYNVHGISSKMGILIFFWELGLVEENLISNCWLEGKHKYGKS